MAHTHSVIDTDMHFKIDGKTRVVTNTSEVKKSVFQYDHNSERFTFEIPRLIDGHDMTQCDIIQIHYINIDSQKRHYFADVYEVTDAKVSDDDPNIMTCSWLISNRATQYVGSLNFVIRFICYDTDGTPTYVWSTAVHTYMAVESSINNGESIVIDYSDILVQWEERLFGIGDTVEQQMRNSADEKLAAFDETAAQYLAQMNMDEVNTKIASKGDNLYFDEETKLLYLTSDGNIIGDGIAVSTGGGSGGGSGSGNNAVISMQNTTGWIYKTVASGASCPISFTWSSLENDIETGPGAVRITINGIVKYQASVNQGSHTIDISEHLSAGSNAVKVNVTDVYGNTRSIALNVTSVSLSMTSSFDGTAVQSGAFNYVYTPVGAITKTVHFVMDGAEIGTSTVATSGRQQTFSVPSQTHGVHTFEAYFTAEINEELVESNRLKYALICVEEGNNTPIIAVDFWKTDVEQFDSVTIPWRAYVANSMTVDVVLSAPDLAEDKVLTGVDRTVQTWSYRPDIAGTQELKITCGTVFETITMNVAESKIDVSAETESLSLYLSSYGRSNNEANPATWTSGDIAANFTNFNFVSDGWVTDADGVTVLRVSGDARLEIPLKLFKDDFRSTGKTVEIEFATRDILNYDAVIMSCWSNDRGLQLTSQRALLKSEQSAISTQYKEDEHVRLSFVVQKRSDYRLMMVYINGILSGVIRYPDGDDFSQANPVNITVGSNDCTIDLYNIRVYDNDLTRFQVLDNWIADTQIASLKNVRWKHNNVFDQYGKIVIAQLPKDLPYMIINAATLPAYKGNKVTVSGEYVDPVDSSRSFTFEGAEADVQGTSSAGYARKNYKIKFKGGFIQNGETYPNYQLRSNSVPTNVFTFKADVASSEGANNVELVRLYNDACPYKTPPQLEDSTVRQGIDGYPIVIFQNTGTETVFIGKYNFNNDKGTPEVFGFDENDESWEILNNTSDRVVWKNDDFTGTDWLNDFEGRHPDGNTDPTNLAALATWIKSTDRSAVSTDEEKEARLTKFKNELGNWMDVDSTLFYYLFTELFLMVDSRAKNAFPTRYDNGKWCWLPYDMDTAIGINNEGSLTFGYELEDIDRTSTGADVYNGQDSVLWINVRDGFKEELMAMYQKLRSDNVISYADTESRFEEHQAKWPVAIFNEDAYFKYLEPLFTDNTAAYLSMLQGSKAEQRKWWLYNRFRYIDSKYNAGDAKSDMITVRGYAKSDITITPYADIYASIKYGSYLVQTRALRGSSYVLECPLDNVNDTETYIYSASQLADVGDLSGYMVGYAEFSMATKLQSLKLGDASESYSNAHLNELYLGNNTLLKTLDVRNCPNLGTGANSEGTVMTDVDISGCTNIEHIYFDGTSIKALNLPNGGIIKTLHLPGTITSLVIRNHSSITDFVIGSGSGTPDYSGITTLRLENVSDVVPMQSILSGIPDNSRVRLIGFDWSFDSAADILTFYDRLDTMRGLDENGNNVDKAQMSGTVRVENITGAQLSEMQSRYPDISVLYQHITSYLYFYDYTGSNVLQILEVADGGDGSYTGSTPTKASTAQYTYAFAGWSLTPGGEVNADAMKNVTADRSVYAAFTSTVRTYTVYWKNGSTTLETDTNVPYGTVPTYNGSTPIYNGSGDAADYEFKGWTPTVGAITGDTTYTAKFKYTGYVYTNLIDRSVTDITSNVSSVGTYAFSFCSNLESADFQAATRIDANAFSYCESLTTINFPAVTNVGNSAFFNCTALTSIEFPAATSIDASAFHSCDALTKADFHVATSIGDFALSGCYVLTAVILRSDTMCTLTNKNAFAGCYHIQGTVNLAYNPDGLKDGYIYVPVALVDTYKADSVWSTYASQIRAIEDYPEICGGESA